MGGTTTSPRGEKMGLSRRQFLKTIAAGTFALTTGIGLDDLLPTQKTFDYTKSIVTQDSIWDINTKARTIQHTGGNASVKLLDLYRHLMDLWDEDHMMDMSIPMDRATDTMFNLRDNWLITEDSYEYLCGGSVKDEARGDLWTNFQTMGTVEGIGKLDIIQDGNVIATNKTPIKNHLDMVVKVQEDFKMIDKGRVLFRSRSKHDAPMLNPKTKQLYYDKKVNEFLANACFGVAAVPIMHMAPIMYPVK